MTTIVTRVGKGSSLSWDEMDDNLNNLNGDKIETSAIGVSVQPYDATILVDADIGVNVEAYDATILKDADIGISVQGYDSTTTKNAATQTLTNKTVLASGSNIVEATAGPSSSQLSGLRNKIINGGFAVNQRVYVSGAAVGTNLYGHDRWKMAASADTYTFATTENKTTVTIPAGKVLRQVIEGLNLQTGTYTLSWEGTAQGKIGAGAYGASGVTGSITGGTDTTIEFGPGTVANVQLEFGSIATPFEQRPIGLELALCQRYYETGLTNWIGYQVAGGGLSAQVNFAVQKRGTPVLTKFNFSNIANSATNEISIGAVSGCRHSCQSIVAGSLAASESWTASAEL